VRLCTQPISFILFACCAFVTRLQKAQLPISTTDEGTETAVSSPHSEKACSPMTLALSFMITSLTGS
jgi:hypothetical protein